MSLGKTEMLCLVIFLLLLYQSVLSKWPRGTKFTLVQQSTTSECNVFGSLKKKKENPKEHFFLRRTDLTFYLELFKLPQNAKKIQMNL